jgi:hypothetical protein
MAKRSFGLHKALSQILRDVRIPEELTGHALESRDTASQPPDCARLDPIALFQEMARRGRCRAAARAGLNPQLQLHDFTGPHDWPDHGLQQRVVEFVDAKTIASEILGISELRFWFLRVRGRIGPKPIKVNGSLIWTLSSIIRWIEWGCCGMADFQAREQRALQQTSRTALPPSRKICPDPSGGIAKQAFADSPAPP